MSDHMLRAVLASALLVLGCGGGGGNDVDLTPPNGFWVSPSRAEVAMGWSVNLAAVGVYSGATDVTTAASWSSDAPEIATVQAGVVTGVREGTATITASLGKSTSTAVVTVGHHLKAFVTPVNGTANFSTWAGAGGKIGLAAADAICQASAQAAGLPRVFRAWLSDSRNDASCRVAGYAGKMYPDNCGQATRPTAGPWVRMDGFPFASLDKLYDYDVHVPIRFDTYGAEVDDVAWIFPYGGDVVCEDWTSSAKTSSSTTSLVYTPRYVWSLATQQSRSLDCNGIARLLCLEVGVGAPAPIPPSSSRVAFVTSVMGTGQLSSWPESGGKDGLAGADAVCQARAAAARLDNPDRFKAWITDGTAAPLERLTSDGPWARVDGVPLAKNRAELGAVPLFTTLDLTEIGSRLANVNLIWTGAGPDPDANCMGWTSSSIYSRGSNGWTWSVTEWSSHRLINSCNVALPIYCFED